MQEIIVLESPKALQLKNIPAEMIKEYVHFFLILYIEF